MWHLHFKRGCFLRNHIPPERIPRVVNWTKAGRNKHERIQEIVSDLNLIGALIYCIKICLQDYWVSLYWFVCHSSPRVATKNTIWHQSEKVVQPAGLINGERGFLRLFTSVGPRRGATPPTNEVRLEGLQFCLISRKFGHEKHARYYQCCWKVAGAFRVFRVLPYFGECIYLPHRAGLCFPT